MQNRRRKRFMMAGKAPRSFTISPAVGGKTTWDLDVDGPLNLGTSGTWTLTPLVNFKAFGKEWGGGGAGGTGSQHRGGAGGAITAEITFLAGVAYSLMVAESGRGTVAGLPGGGLGRDSGYGGGGYTAIFIIAGNVPILIAAGGGGGGNGGVTAPGDGGAGGGLVGQNGSIFNAANSGMGATQTAGGIRDGSYLQGGPSWSTGAGGGGGGYYGGGGGNTDDTTYRAPGGGGSSYANPSHTANVTHYAGNFQTPGLSADPDRGTAGNRSISSTNVPGRLVLS